MKTAVLFAMIAAVAIVVGAYSTTQQQAEREAWGAENDRLLSLLADLERQIEEQAKRQVQEVRADEPPEELTDAIEQLSSVEAEILEHRAELVQLKSDRLVADEHAKSSLETLRRQVRKSTEIERGLATLQSRKLQIEKRIAEAEEQISGLAGTIAARQDYAASLDQKIAELVVRQEAVNSRLKLAEQAETLQVIAAEDLEAIKAGTVDRKASVKTIKAAAPKLEQRPTAETTASIAAGPAGAEAGLDQDRSKGLYQFKNLSVEQGVGGPAPVTEDEAKLAARTDAGADDQFAPAQWAKKQYELGRALVTHSERNSGTRELKEAILAFRAVLGEWTRDDHVLRWAATQNDLCYALALLGQRQRDVGVLEKAAIACRDALSETGRQGVPLLWATIQYNLGLTLSAMATARDDEVLWQNAIKALQQSAEAFASKGARAEADKSLNRLQDAHDQLTALKRPS